MAIIIAVHIKNMDHQSIQLQAIIWGIAMDISSSIARAIWIMYAQLNATMITKPMMITSWSLLMTRFGFCENSLKEGFSYLYR